MIRPRRVLPAWPLPTTAFFARAVWPRTPERLAWECVGRLPHRTALPGPSNETPPRFVGRRASALAPSLLRGLPGRTRLLGVAPNPRGLREYGACRRPDYPRCRARLVAGFPENRSKRDASRF